MGTEEAKGVQQSLDLGFERLRLEMASSSDLVISRLSDMEAKVEKLDESIRGNGQPGLSGRVRSLEEAREQHSGTLTELRGKYDHLVWWVIGLLLACAAGLLTALYNAVGMAANTR
jgi:predicted outer membrane lipoprotein